MKRVHLYAASALLSAALVSGLASAVVAQPAASETKPMVQEKEAMPPRMMRPKPLSEDKMKLVQEAKEKMKKESEPLLKEEERLRKEKHDLLMAKAFDGKAYLAKENEMQKVRTSLAELRAKTVADLAPKLDPEERPGLMRMLWDGPKGHHGGKRGMGMGPRNGMMSDDMPSDDREPGKMMDR